MEDLGGDLLVTLGTPDRGLKVRLVPESDRLMIEDLHVIGSELPGGKIELVNAMRNWLNAEASRPTPRSKPPQPRTNLVSPLAIAPQSVPADGEVLPAGTGDLPIPPTTTPASELPTPKAAPDQRPLLQRPIRIPGA